MLTSTSNCQNFSLNASKLWNLYQLTTCGTVRFFITQSLVALKNVSFHGVTFLINTIAPDAEWVEEFVDITDEDVEATFSKQQDFWSKMENEWKEMAEKNKETGEHPWLDDFEEV